MSVTLKEFQEKIQSVARINKSKGYADRQKAIKGEVKRVILRDAKIFFPEIADYLGTEDYNGLGHYSCYSNFKLTYKGWPILGIGTHTSTIETARYSAEYDIKYSDRICEQENVNDISEIDHVLTLDKIVASCMKYSKQSKRAAIEFEIKEKAYELEKLKAQLLEV